MLTKEQFLLGMGKLQAGLDKKDIDPEVVDVYWERLNNRLNPQQWERAVNYLVDTSKYFPRICEILEAADLGRPAAEDLWGRLLVAAEDGKKPPLDAPTEVALLAVGGWQAFQVTPYDELKFMFKMFKDTYLVAVKQEKAQVALPGPGEQSGQGVLEN